VEGLHVVGGIISKISINYVLIYMLRIYTCFYFMGFVCVCCMYIFTVIST
jgi:mannose/fructose/N-acetylgalactosamine-specific phosphotransferase system component IIC